MSGFHKLCLVLCFAAASTAAHGQTLGGTTQVPSRDTMSLWIQGTDQRELAWAAVLALKDDARYFLPAFLSLAERWEPLPHRNVLDREDKPTPVLTREQRERRDAMAAVLDTIIQWRGELPPASIRNLADDFPAAAFTMLARMEPSEAEPVLLELYRETAPSSWYTQRAAASLLAAHPPSDFPASLLKNTTVVASIFVSLPDDGSFGRGSSGGSCGAYGPPAEKKSWPAIGRYSMSESRKGSKTAAFLTIPGLKPIDIVRSVTPTLEGDPSACGGLTPLNSPIRLTLIAQMLGETPEQLPFSYSDQTNLKIVNEPDYERQVGDFVDRKERAFAALKTELAAKQLLTTKELEDTDVLPSLVLSISDVRSIKSFPLTPLKFRIPSVREVFDNWGTFIE